MFPSILWFCFIISQNRNYILVNIFTYPLCWFAGYAISHACALPSRPPFACGRCFPNRWRRSAGGVRAKPLQRFRRKHTRARRVITGAGGGASARAHLKSHIGRTRPRGFSFFPREITPAHGRKPPFRRAFQHQRTRADPCFHTGWHAAGIIASDNPYCITMPGNPVRFIGASDTCVSIVR